MQKYKKIIIGLVVVVLIILGVSFSKSSNTPEGTVKIGVVSSLTGPWPEVGEAFKNGTVLAIEDYKLKNNNKFQIIVEDDGVDLKKGLTAYKKLTELDKVDAMINLSSPTLEPMIPLLKNTDMPFVQIFEQPKTPSDNRIVQISPYTVDSASELARMLESKFSSKDITFVYTQDPTVSIYLDNFEKGLVDKNINKQAVIKNSRDMKSTAISVASSKPKVIVIALFEESIPLFIKEYEKIKNSDTKYAFMFVSSSLSQHKKILGDTNKLNGTIVPVFKEYSSQVFRDKYKKRFGIDPVIGAEYGYDSISLLVETYNKDPKTWQKNILSKSFTGESGFIQFNDLGLRKPEFKFKEIVNGELPVY